MREGMFITTLTLIVTFTFYFITYQFFKQLAELQYQILVTKARLENRPVKEVVDEWVDIKRKARKL